MSVTNIALAIGNMCTGILMIGISIPVALNKVLMNHFYGVRFNKSYESKELWYKTNAPGGFWRIVF